MQSVSFTCLIPFYNEGERLISVVRKLSQISVFSKILCVDDGSTDQSVSLLKQHFSQNPKVQWVSHSQNQGKADAIHFGLSSVKTTHVVLFDADLTKFSLKTLYQAIKIVQTHPKLESIILRQLNDPLLLRLLRFDTLCTGERIMKTSDLRNILSTHPKNYQLEIAINQYLFSQKKVTIWLPFYSTNVLKLTKWDMMTAFRKTFEFQTQLFSLTYAKLWLLFWPDSLIAFEKNIYSKKS